MGSVSEMFGRDKPGAKTDQGSNNMETWSLDWAWCFAATDTKQIITHDRFRPMRSFAPRAFGMPCPRALLVKPSHQSDVKTEALNQTTSLRILGTKPCENSMPLLGNCRLERGWQSGVWMSAVALRAAPSAGADAFRGSHARSSGRAAAQQVLPAAEAPRSKGHRLQRWDFR